MMERAVRTRCSTRHPQPSRLAMPDRCCPLPQVKKSSNGQVVYGVVTYRFPILSAKAVPDLQAFMAQHGLIPSRPLSSLSSSLSLSPPSSPAWLPLLTSSLTHTTFLPVPSRALFFVPSCSRFRCVSSYLALGGGSGEHVSGHVT
eukprot:2664416-Rhodomonas_salina.2